MSTKSNSTWCLYKQQLQKCYKKTLKMTLNSKTKQKK